jgi:transcriptional regulator with XRE-family HTH domain
LADKRSVIGARLKDARKAMGYSLEYVAAACNIQQYQTVSKWESGNTFPSLDKLLILCDLYGCDLGYFIGEYDCKTRRNADVRAETGLSENAIKQLRAENAFNEHRIQALNALIEFEDGKILQDVYNFLFHRFDGQIEAGNLVINGDDCADMFLLNIIAEFKNLREKIKGGSENGQH